MGESNRVYDHVAHYRKTIDEQRKIIEDLKNKLYTDDLTGLYSNAFFVAEGQILDSRRENFPLFAIAMIDVDNFKVSANDIYGHGVGDEVLKVVGSAVKDTFRPGDSCCRKGGDEFAVIMPEFNPDTDIDELSTNLESRLESKIHAHFKEYLPEYPKLMDIGISVGLATSGETEEFEDITILADHRMYVSKRAKGKDR